MRRIVLTILVAAGIAQAAAAADDFSPFVDAEGGIALPDDFRSWPALGTWSVAAEDGSGAGELHVVHTQPETVDHYRRTGGFPDGAVLVKELFATETSELTTGLASRAAAVKGWFVMVKDGRGRFPDNPLWGEGWGWAFFTPDNPSTTVTTDYESDCLGCHVPAQATDWVYVQGYPSLHVTE